MSEDMMILVCSTGKKYEIPRPGKGEIHVFTAEESGTYHFEGQDEFWVLACGQVLNISSVYRCPSPSPELPHECR